MKIGRWTPGSSAGGTSIRTPPGSCARRIWGRANTCINIIQKLTGIYTLNPLYLIYVQLSVEGAQKGRPNYVFGTHNIQQLSERKIWQNITGETNIPLLLFLYPEMLCYFHHWSQPGGMFFFKMIQ